MNSVMLNQVSRFVGFFKKVFNVRSNRFEKPREFSWKNSFHKMGFDGSESGKALIEKLKAAHRV